MTEKLAKHPSVDQAQMERRVDEGLIRKSTRGDLSIYNYTEDCQYGRKWDQYTVKARGLILDANGRVVASPFPKFFNLGEADCPALPTDCEYDVFEKVDGSLGIWYFWQGRWNVATRGSLENDYTKYADRFSSLLEEFPEHWTVMTEICMPAADDGMPRAVKHEPGLYFLGAVNRLTLQDYHPHVERERWPATSAKWEGTESIETFLQRAKSTEGTEGWVVRFHNGLRVKIKTTWYLHLFRAISALNEKHVKELMLKAGLDEWLKDFPEELQEEARAIYDGIQMRFVERRERIMKDFSMLNVVSMKRSYAENRKAFALSVKDHPEKAYLFMLYDGKSIDARLLEDC